MKVADGALDNWTFLSQALPEGVEVLDYFHAVEHLSRALSAAYGESSREFHRIHKRLRHKLRDNDDGVEQVIRSLRHLAREHPRSKALRTELGYFRRTEHGYWSLLRGSPSGQGSSRPPARPSRRHA